MKERLSTPSMLRRRKKRPKPMLQFTILPQIMITRSLMIMLLFLSIRVEKLRDSDFSFPCSVFDISQ